LSLSRNALASLIASSEPLIVAHWDADGIASAVTAAGFVSGRADFVIPPFTYRPSRDFLELIARRAEAKDLVLVLDYNVSPEVLVSMAASARKPIVVVDHHIASYPRVPNVYYYNPAAEGDPEGLWPSAAHVLADALGFYDPLLIAMSIYGDLRDGAPRNRVFRYYMEQVGLDPEADLGLLAQCSDQVWGAEAVGDLSALEGLPYELAYGGVDPCQALMSDPRLTNDRLRAEEEVDRAVREAMASRRAEGRAGVYVVSLRARVAGEVARRVKRSSGDPVIVLVAREETMGSTKIYVRGDELNVAKVMKALEGQGIRASGKDQAGNRVLVIDVGQGPHERALQALIEAINAP
jgi:single-stranded DNA-specific DHH superfamily exonuclease